MWCLDLEFGVLYIEDIKKFILLSYAEEYIFQSKWREYIFQSNWRKYMWLENLPRWLSMLPLLLKAQYLKVFSFFHQRKQGFLALMTKQLNKSIS